MRIPKPSVSLSGVRLRSLNTKLVAAFVAIGILPLMAVGIYSVSRADTALTDAAGLRLESVALESGELLDRSLEARYKDVQAFAHIPFMAMGEGITPVLDVVVDTYNDFDLVTAPLRRSPSSPTCWEGRSSPSSTTRRHSTCRPPMRSPPAL